MIEHPFLQNAQGKVMYGMHFYSGLAQYEEPGKEPYRVYLNEDTLRSMDRSFAGRPIFVEHVDEVETDINELRKEADGWVIESFYNAADGKHWVKFIIVTDKAERAIQNGMRLSNAYMPKSFSKGGLWNGIPYAQEITGGEYDHLAIVRNPRYEESVIMTPDEFKAYNENLQIELKKLANSTDQKGAAKMGLNFFKKAKVDNSIDFESLSVVLPKSKKEMSISDLVTEMDVIKNMQGYANGDHMVKLHDGSEMKVSELIDKHKAMNEEMSKMKDEMEHESGAEGAEVDSESSPEMKDNDEAAKDKAMNDEDDKAAKKKALELADHEDKEIEAAKKKNAAIKAAKLRNARELDLTEEVQIIEFSGDQVARGKQRYGSN